MARDFHLPLNVAMDELPLAQGFALMAWSQESNPWCPMERMTDGYIAQEAYQNLGW
jgi:hypothetical protein